MRVKDVGGSADGRPSSLCLAPYHVSTTLSPPSLMHAPALSWNDVSYKQLALAYFKAENVL
ncbi:hypothetical protein E2C01_040846 [Portunus trituberculatus]|uniref:Uncharacterized protein n=1 Tax=Portunus trituberculatus TaxID=210409 RepID=A0A5B7FIH1_PORTR|nr:hypothetical protein [Portunus trituberculatus]